jgi:hypothetical protein
MFFSQFLVAGQEEHLGVERELVWKTSWEFTLTRGAFTWLSVRTYCGTGHWVTVLVLLSTEVLWY